jgi:phi LC3 family holin
MINNLKMNIKNRAWWIALISALIILGKTWGIDLTDYIGKDWQNTVNTICTIAILLGISIDTTTQNIGGIANEVVQEITQNEDNTAIENQTEPTTTTINNDVTQNSAKKEQLQSLLQQLNIIINE